MPKSTQVCRMRKSRIIIKSEAIQIAGKRAGTYSFFRNHLGRSGRTRSHKSVPPAWARIGWRKAKIHWPAAVASHQFFVDGAHISQCNSNCTQAHLVVASTLKTCCTTRIQNNNNRHKMQATKMFDKWS